MMSLKARHWTAVIGAATMLGSAGPLMAVTYSTGFEAPAFSTGSIDGQDGWLATDPSFEQSVVNTVAHSGTQSWLRNSNYTTGSFSNQPFSATMPGGAIVGETTVPGVTSQTQMYSVWFRAADTVAADGSFVNLALTDTLGDRMNYVGIYNTDAGGLTLTAYDVTSNGFGNAASFNPYSLTTVALDRTAWHEVRVETTFIDGGGNDIVNYYVDGSLVATLGSWEDYYRDDPEQAGFGNQLPAADRVWFGTRTSPDDLGFTTGDASGFYFDDFTSSTEIPEPASLGLIALGGLALIRRRRTA